MVMSVVTVGVEGFRGPKYASPDKSPPVIYKLRLLFLGALAMRGLQFIWGLYAGSDCIHWLQGFRLKLRARKS